jgi:hypothetical protein
MFEAIWFCGSFLDPIWSVLIPLGHRVAVPVMPNIPFQKHNMILLNMWCPETG